MKPQIRTIAPLALSLVALSGCGPKSMGPPVRAIIAMDVSCRAEERLTRLAGAAYEAQRSAPKGSQVTVYAFGHKCMPVFDGERTLSRSGFNEAVGPFLLRPPHSLTGSGTRAELALERIALDASESKEPVVALIATDGGVEDQSPRVLGRIRQAVKALSKSRNLRRLVVVGVSPEHRLTWAAWLAPLGGKATVRGDSDAERVVRDFGSEVAE